MTTVSTTKLEWQESNALEAWAEKADVDQIEQLQNHPFIFVGRLDGQWHIIVSEYVSQEIGGLSFQSNFRLCFISEESWDTKEEAKQEAQWFYNQKHPLSKRDKKELIKHEAARQKEASKNWLQRLLDF